MADLNAALPSTCSITIPTADTELHDVVPRWSNHGVSLPYAVVTPSTVEDLTSTISFATANHKKIIPANGGHGSFVPINGETIYLDMRNFNAITLDEEHGTVKIEGGCVSKDVLTYLAGQGWYTTLPNSNAVGVIGSFLGGLSHALNGMKGFGIDHVQAITIVPFSHPDGFTPHPITLTTASTGEEKALFNALCGAGHGLGIITSLTLTAWPIPCLNMTNDQIWTRRLIFPPTQIEAAARLYTSLLPPPAELNHVLGFLRAPPTAPVPGAPMVLLSLSYFGPAAAADEACKATYEEEYTSKAITAVTGTTGFANMNDAFDAINAHAGYKEYHGCFCAEVDAASIVSAFEDWVRFSAKDAPARSRSYVVIGAWSTEALLKNAGKTGEKFFAARDRGVFVQATPWYSELGVKGEADAWGKGVVKKLRERDRAVGRRDWCFANNVLAGQDVREVYSEDMIAKIGDVRRVWDKNFVGWGIVDGW
ncbi:FAD-binding domain-containing protein [Polyplosphaeria fusca]|uniref:FAD-binding domain-containing protein n=1 Tax=Polyplosphaeria fusca TaxID=682080 RepID=A0A9P4QQ43_9PLEO|nr:FAD-binding domain-containing protein [Polyplosphaeria fusca]